MRKQWQVCAGFDNLLDVLSIVFSVRRNKERKFFKAQLYVETMICLYWFWQWKDVLSIVFSVRRKKEKSFFERLNVCENNASYEVVLAIKRRLKYCYLYKKEQKRKGRFFKGQTYKKTILAMCCFWQ